MSATNLCSHSRRQIWDRSFPRDRKSILWIQPATLSSPLPPTVVRAVYESHPTIWCIPCQSLSTGARLCSHITDDGWQSSADESASDSRFHPFQAKIQRRRPGLRVVSERIQPLRGSQFIGTQLGDRSKRIAAAIFARLTEYEYNTQPTPLDLQPIPLEPYPILIIHGMD